MPEDFITEEIHKVSEEDISDLYSLMGVLSEGFEMERSVIDRILSDSSSHIYAIRHKGRIVATASLSVSVSPTGVKGDIEDVVVNPQFQGMHLGRKIVEHIISEAYKYAPMKLRLTSRSSRIAANNLYRSLGFKQKETNYYTLAIENQV